MWATNLKIAAVVVLTLGAYTALANVIPQVESEVPERTEISADVSTEELVSLGEEIFHGAGGCEACHGLGTRAPDLLGVIGTRCGEREPGKSCKQYLHESLAEPGAFVVEGFQPIMPDMDTQLSSSQIWAVVAFLQSQGGEVTVTSEDLAATEGGGGSGGGAAGGGGSGGAAAGGATAAATAPGALMEAYGCVACHRVAGEGGEIGPSVEEIRASGRSSDYLRRSILEPAADTAPGFEQVAGTMPPNFGQRLTVAQLDTLVAFLSRGASNGSGGAP